MNRIDVLEQKVRQAVERILSLQKENQRLQAELNFHVEENKRAKQAMRENETLLSQRRAAAGRIEKILKKLHSIA